MARKQISSIKVALLKFELTFGDALRKKVALQELSKLYRNGFYLSSEIRKEFERLIVSELLITGQDEKVVRWGLNSLALMGQRASAEGYIKATIEKYDGRPQIVASGVAALANMYRHDISALEIKGSVSPTIQKLAALQFVDARKIDLRDLRIDIYTADPEVLKLALIATGLNRDIENFFHPRHSNGEIIRRLCRHDDVIVVQYCVWSVLENRFLSIDHLGISFDDLEKYPPNIQSKLLQLAAEKEADQIRRHDVVSRGVYLSAAEARVGLAKGLTNEFYDGLEDITLDWYDQENSQPIKNLLVEHFARFSDVSRPYEDKALEILEAEPKVKDRLLVGAEGKRLYRKIQEADLRAGTPDLFDNKDPALMKMIRAAQSVGGQAKLKKTVLFLAADPLDEGRLRISEEARDLKQELQRVIKKEVDVSIEHEWAVKVDQIQAAIFNARPSILHFSGHGGGGSLCFEDRNGNSAPLSASVFGELLELAKPECLVLNACFSQDIADVAIDHVGAVVGCTDSIDDDAAIAFTRAFYRALANGESYERSFRYAVIEVKMTVREEEAKIFHFKKR